MSSHRRGQGLFNYHGICFLSAVAAGRQERGPQRCVPMWNAVSTGPSRAGMPPEPRIPWEYPVIVAGLYN